MHMFNSLIIRALLIAIVLLFVAGCSGGSQSSVEAEVATTETDDVIADDASGDVMQTETATEVQLVQPEPINNPSMPDPLIQNITRVDFGITVPAYMSDALELRVVWGDLDFVAEWVGDEFWSVSNDFPSDTENPLTVSFSDDNGAITLGTFEQNFRTGTNASQSFDITADQFDTDRWDSDGDGVSNINAVSYTHLTLPTIYSV